MKKRGIKMKVLIGGAWVYANGPLHIGHIAGLLPGDVIARYYRAKGEEVSYVSGSDCHGTPITIKAKEEGKSPLEISDYYHEDFKKGFDYLGFSYDYYGKTSSKEHIKFCVDFHEKLYESPYIYESEEPQAYCNNCQRFLPDRLVEGRCPNCGGLATGEQCDHCGSLFHSSELLESFCHDCHKAPVFKTEKHLYLGITRLRKELKNLVDKGSHWRKNALDFTNRYINDGLRDRAITRSLDWGIHVPKEGYEDKRIYIWAENVLGYISSNKAHCDRVGRDYREFWQENSRQYYVHGKDNIPFHTIILPSLQLAEGEFVKLPDYIVSSEYLTLEGSKISTSEDWAVWINDLIGEYNPDTIRYYLLANNPDKRDTDFSFRELLYANNSELLGGYGNFINRTLTFIKKSCDNKIPEGKLNPGVQDKVLKTYSDVGALIEEGWVKAAIRKAFETVRFANKYFDENKPWIYIKEDVDIAHNTLYNCVYLIENLAKILEPFLPFSGEKVLTWFELEKNWSETLAKPGQELADFELLFQRLDEKIVDRFSIHGIIKDKK